MASKEKSRAMGSIQRKNLQSMLEFGYLLLLQTLIHLLSYILLYNLLNTFIYKLFFLDAPNLINSNKFKTSYHFYLSF